MPSLRNKTTEYVRTSIQKASGKIPLSSSGRFNTVMQKAKIPARLRTLRADLKGLLGDDENKDKREDVEEADDASLVDEKNAELCSLNSKDSLQKMVRRVSHTDVKLTPEPATSLQILPTRRTSMTSSP